MIHGARAGGRVPWLVAVLRARDRRLGLGHTYATAAQMLDHHGRGARAPEEIEAAFFGSVLLANGTYKTTSARRLDDLNDLIHPVLPARRPARIKDVAVSSGISTAEWSEQLSRVGIEHTMLATDLTISAWLVRLGGRANVLIDRHGAILQVDLAGYPVYPRVSGLDARLKGLPTWILARQLSRHLATLMRPPLGAAQPSLEEVDLINPRVRQLGIAVRQEDLAAPRTGAADSEERWDAIRAANILNRDYFAPDDMRRMIAGLVATLKPDGVLAVCRTEPDQRNHGSVARRQPDGPLEVISRVGRGSEVEDLMRSVHG